MVQDFLASGLASVPACAIVMWSGLVSDVPDGWSICDGTNGTPDLREKFVRGTGGEAGGEGGCASHKHPVGYYITCATGCHATVSVAAGCSYMVATPNHCHSLSINTTQRDNIPPYYELIFIRKD